MSVRDMTHVGTDTVRAEGPSAFELLAGRGWDALVAAGGVHDPLRTTAWLRLWVDRASQGSSPRAVAVMRDGAMVAGAPLEVTRRGGLRVVRHLAQGDAWFHVAPPAADPDAFAALLRAIAAEDGDILLLDGLPGDDATRAAVRAAIPAAQIVDGETWRLTTASPPRSVRKRRKEARRAVRRAADQGVELTVRWWDRWVDIGPRVAELLAFHHRHFPGDTRNQLAEPGPRRAYVADAIAALGAEGRARLAEVRVGDGDLVAWDLAFVGDDGTAVAYAGAFDRSRTDLMTLGWISMLEMVDRLTEEGVAMVDFGAWPAPYKDLIAEPVPVIRVVAPLSRRGRAGLVARDAAGRVAGWAAARRRRGVPEDAPPAAGDA